MYSISIQSRLKKLCIFYLQAHQQVSVCVCVCDESLYMMIEVCSLFFWGEMTDCFLRTDFAASNVVYCLELLQLFAQQNQDAPSTALSELLKRSLPSLVKHALQQQCSLEELESIAQKTQTLLDHLRNVVSSVLRICAGCRMSHAKADI